MPIEYNSDGIITQNLTEILDERENALKSILGEDFVIDKNTPIGNMELADANSEQAIQELIAWMIPNMLDANTATGYFLDCICEKNRIYRIQPQYTTLRLILHGTPATIFYANDITVSDNVNDIYYNLGEQCVIGSDGTVTAKFICQFYGEYYPVSGSTFNILTPVNGLDSVTIDYDNADIVVGRSVETDEELRRRRMESVQQTSTSTLASIKANLFSVNGVEHVKYIENDTEQENKYGVPMKSFEFIVDGGDSKEIAQTIFNVKPAGTRAYGSTPVNIIDSEGDTHEVGYTKAQNVNIGISIELRTKSRQSKTWENKIKDALKEKFDNIQDINVDVKDYNYYTVLTQFNEISDILSLEFYNIEDEQTHETVYPISIRQIAKLDIQNIQISS